MTTEEEEFETRVAELASEVVAAEDERLIYHITYADAWCALPEQAERPYHAWYNTDAHMNWTEPGLERARFARLCDEGLFEEMEPHHLLITPLGRAVAGALRQLGLTKWQVVDVYKEACEICGQEEGKLRAERLTLAQPCERVEQGPALCWQCAGPLLASARGGVRAFIVKRDVVRDADMVPDVPSEEMMKAQTWAEMAELEMKADWLRPEYGPVTMTVTLQVAGDPGFLLDVDDGAEVVLVAVEDCKQ